jgi:hypothetical protein
MARRSLGTNSASVRCLFEDKTMRHNTLVRVPVLLIACSVVACSHSPEIVFERQNQAAATLARMTMEMDPQQAARLDRIYAAEKRLQVACEPIRQVASTRLDGQSATAESELIALASLNACESETQWAESFIRQEAPESARLNFKQRPP